MVTVEMLLEGLANGLNDLPVEDRVIELCKVLQKMHEEAQLYNPEVFNTVTAYIDASIAEGQAQLQKQHKENVAKLDKAISVGEVSPSDYIRKRADSLKGVVRASKTVSDAKPPAIDKTAQNRYQAFKSGYAKTIPTVDHRVPEPKPNPYGYISNQEILRNELRQKHLDA